MKKLENGKSTTFEVLRLAGQAGDAQAQLAETPEEVIAAWEHQVRNCTGLVTEMRRRLEVGRASQLDVLQAEAECAAAEIKLLRAKRAFQKTP